MPTPVRLLLLGPTGIWSTPTDALVRNKWPGKGRLISVAGMAGLDPKTLASTDIVGEGAIAVGRKGNLWIHGVSLGRPSALDAENRAMEQCRSSEAFGIVVGHEENDGKCRRHAE